MGGKSFSNAIFTDLYELTMVQAYWQNNMIARARFSLFFRQYPPNRAYFVAAGLEEVLDYLQDFRFADDDLNYLRSTGQFQDAFLDSLKELRFTGNVRAMQEGTIFFASEPVLEVEGPMIEVQLIETFLINQINLQTILATKASRVVHAARGKTVVDFAARRTHGTEAANKMARSSYISGFAGTSNVLAGGLYDIPTVGTMAHSFITAFEDETEAFRAYARSFPDTSTFLVDTYDTLEGTRNAARVALEMREHGHELRAIRLDSGDMLDLSLKAREILDKAGLSNVQIFASGGLDEFEVERLLSAGAAIDGFGVGTKVGVSADAPWTDCAYKLVEYDGRPTLKLSTEKQTLAGAKQVFRYRDPQGKFSNDVIAAEGELQPSNSESLLQTVMTNGAKTAEHPILSELRQRFAREFVLLPDEHKVIEAPAEFDVRISHTLAKLQDDVTADIRKRAS
jgi:nicotinate phosphoribosyltransferase